MRIPEALVVIVIVLVLAVSCERSESRKHEAAMAKLEKSGAK